MNTTDSAVRITHVPTGLVVSQQDEKSQHKNKAKALKVLRSRLLDQKIAEQEAERSRERRAQVGTGDRSAKIRTYNFPQSRVTDHRIKLTVHNLAQVLGRGWTDMVTTTEDHTDQQGLAAIIRHRNCAAVRARQTHTLYPLANNSLAIRQRIIMTEA